MGFVPILPDLRRVCYQLYKRLLLPVPYVCPRSLLDLGGPEIQNRSTNSLRHFRIVDAFHRGKIGSPHGHLGRPVPEEGHSITQNLRNIGFRKFPAVPAREPCQVGRLSVRRRKGSGSLKIVSVAHRQCRA